MRIPKWNEKSWIILVFLFLLVFPKGGFKILSVPLTWGYLLLGLSGLAIAAQKQWIVSRSHLFVLFAQAPFQLITLSTLCVNGIGIDSTALTLAFIIHFFLFPILFFGLFSQFIENIDLDFFISFFKKGVFFISSFGIVLFFLKIITGKFLLIPLLTSNLQDYDAIELTKCIARGDLFKLISTYNNGNLYGICLLMILPLYQAVDKSPWKRIIIKLSLLLTLSRTIWVGLIIEELLNQFYVNKLNRRTFVLFLSRWLAVAFSIFLLLYFLDYNLSFVFDPTIGGRANQFSILLESTLIGKIPFAGLGEITYLNILSHFGILGLISFLISMTAPLWVHFVFKRTKTSLLQRSIVSGLVIYLIISCSDGAGLLIPVMVFYWFLAGLLLAKQVPSYLTISPEF